MHACVCLSVSVWLSLSLSARLLACGAACPPACLLGWLAFSALLGGLKKSSQILEKLENYLSEKQIEEITNNLKEFLEKKAFKKDKRAIIQIAKLYEAFIEPPDKVNAYTWYNIAVAQGIKSAKSKRDKVLESLNEKELLAYNIAKNHLGESYSLVKSNGFLEFLKKQKTKSQTEL